MQELFRFYLKLLIIKTAEYAESAEGRKEDNYDNLFNQASSGDGSCITNYF